MNNEEHERLRLLIPCKKRPKRLPVEYEWVENPMDGSLAQAFSFGTMSDSDIKAIDAAAGAVIAYCPFDLGEGREKVLKLVRTIYKKGGLAVRVEQSKLGWEIKTWLSMVGGKDPRALHRAVVVMLNGADYVQSCGMHAFSLPDARVAVDDEGFEMQELLTVLNVYQLAEDPILLSGQTFTPEPEAPKRVFERWPDDSYPSSEICHNPFGVWRVGPPGGQSRPQSELTPVFVPALVTILIAQEQKTGVPLTREQVEKTRDEAPCIAMTHRDAKKFEQKRGYSDLNPELAWEQWQVVRKAN